MSPASHTRVNVKIVPTEAKQYSNILVSSTSVNPRLQDKAAWHIKLKENAIKAVILIPLTIL